MKHYIIGVAIALDILANAMAGGDHYSTISCRIGWSIKDGGWASRIPWPASWRQHFLDAVFETTV